MYNILFLKKLFKNLLNTWSNQTSIINTSFEQHFYLTKCIIVSESFMEEKDRDVLADGKFRDVKKKTRYLY